MTTFYLTEDERKGILDILQRAMSATEYVENEVCAATAGETSIIFVDKCSFVKHCLELVNHIIEYAEHGGNNHEV